MIRGKDVRMAQKVDVIVIGTGSAAWPAMLRCRRAGLSVVAADSAPYGGTSWLRGCIPKIILTEVSRQVQHCRRLGEVKVIDTVPHINWRQLIDFKNNLIREVPTQMAAKMRDLGVIAVQGTARFHSPSVVEVGQEQFEGRYILIASGARPRPLGIPGEEFVITSDAFLNLPALPERLVFIGGGYISMEFAHVAARSRAKVTVLERGQRLLRQFDQVLTHTLLEASREAGLDVRTNVEVIAVERQGHDLVVHAKQDGNEITLQGDMVVHGAGRIPNTAGLDPKTGNVQIGKHAGVVVNEHLQSVSNERVYSAGDCAETPGMQLAPVAALEGDVAALNMLGGNRRTVNYKGIPTVVFTSPRLAFVGLTEEQAASQGLTYDVIRREGAVWQTNRRLNLKYAGSSVLIDRRRGRIVGASLLGPDSEEVINLFGLAIRNDIPLADLQDMPFAYPTGAWDIKDMVSEGGSPNSHVI